jgi:tetratricopeptide (TPR) repeat protein
VAEEYRAAVEAALELAGPAPVADPAELDPIGSISYEAVFYYSIVNRDQSKIDALLADFESMARAHLDQNTKELGHLETTCVEERERSNGDAALGAKDYAGAQRHYEAALAINPAHEPSLNNLSVALYYQDDLSGAIDLITRLLAANPESARGWANLALYQIAAGNGAARDEALSRFFELAAARPPAERLALVRTFATHLRELVAEEHPEAADAVTGSLPALIQGADSMAPDVGMALQYPAIYAEIAETALLVGDASQAAALARRALQLDRRNPAAHAVLVLAQQAQGADAAAETAAAIENTRDPIWTESAFVEPATVLAAMSEVVDRYVRHVGEVAPAVEHFRQTIAAEITSASED